MKRLLYYLQNISDNGIETFRYTVMEDGHPVQKEIYEGECAVARGEHFGVRREPTYWQDDIPYTFERTSKLALDRPTVTIAIPVTKFELDEPSFTCACADFCLRKIKPFFDEVNAQYHNTSRPDSDNGKFYIYAPGGEVLIRNTAYFAKRPAKDYENGRGSVIYDNRFDAPLPDRLCLCIRIEIQLPHNKLKRAIKMLTSDLPGTVGLFIRGFNHAELREALVLEEKQNEIRKFLQNNEYCAFIANGSFLAREKGTSLPMKDSLPFISTPEDEIEIFGIRGMKIKRGVTVITGGGYSGKSTVLNAVAAGIYNHIKGDGRELCITDDSAVTITAEDGRAISCLNLSPFIKWLPDGSTYMFSTAHASGSTSEAANIMEAIGSGAKLLLIDEDRSATNFMIRDAVMKELVEKEPITPFTDRVRELSANNISTILVIGGSSEYLSVADKIYMMDDFIIHDVTARAKNLVSIASAPPTDALWSANRILYSDNFTSYPEGSGTEKLEVSDTGFIIIGDERIDIRALHNIETSAQINALAFMLRFLERGASKKDELEVLTLSMRGLKQKSISHKIDVSLCISELYAQIKRDGLNIVDSGFFTSMNRFLDLPREIELKAIVNRMRRLTWSNTDLKL